ncbi:hypothetical protein [Micromonospora costi]|uniref:Uncharacterized protein n=1 Tax=Micromonospora costi TaxID=1530042 RepID=A0A3B0A6I1_9ACTN|nr:hypothetical protein [Micromonospora costi]RKN55971.1 hypothetical protein D7193_15405 [Micromonospora costi]
MWPCKRRRTDAPLDATGPATVYPYRSGALPARGEDEEPPVEPGWDGRSTIPTVSPVVPPGQIGRDTGRRE